MKKILFVVMLTISSMLSFAGVIMTTNNERIEDVNIQSETDSTIIYLQNGVVKSIPIEQVSGILYDDGQYRELLSERVEFSVGSTPRNVKTEQQKKEERQHKECQKTANKLFNKKFQEVYSQCIKAGYTQEDAKIKAREEAAIVKEQALRDCIATTE